MTAPRTGGRPTKKAKAKTARETVAPTVKAVGRPFQKGADPRRGHGLPGRSGPKTNAFKAECEAATDDLVLPKILAKLQGADVDDPNWRWAAEFVASHSKSKAPTKQETDVTVRAGVVVLPAPDAPVTVVERA